MNFLIVLVIFFIALTIHEYAHGWVAFRRGDSTANYLGRLTLNPLAHIDPVGTIIVPLVLVIINSPFVFGWAKPVPINFQNLHNPKRDMIFVGLAGPLANLIFAFLLALIVKYFMFNSTVVSFLITAIRINLFLAVFNLLPVPPLDGSRILFGLLPKRLAIKYLKLEQFGFMIVIILLYLGVVNLLVMPVVNFLTKFSLGI